MEFILGALLFVLLFLAASYGAHLGKEMAVDQTKRDGYFESYGKKWRAVALNESPGIEPAEPRNERTDECRTC